MNESFPKEVEARVREACVKNSRVIEHIYSFLSHELGKESVQDILELSKEDQTEACLNHLRIGVEVGDIQLKDIEALITT